MFKSIFILTTISNVPVNHFGTENRFPTILNFLCTTNNKLGENDKIKGVGVM